MLFPALSITDYTMLILKAFNHKALRNFYDFNGTQIQGTQKPNNLNKLLEL
jgi:hypothetical protein